MPKQNFIDKNIQKEKYNLIFKDFYSIFKSLFKNYDHFRKKNNSLIDLSNLLKISKNQNKITIILKSLIDLNNIKKIIFISKFDINLDRRIKKNDTIYILHYLIQNNHKDILEIFINKFKNINHKNEFDNKTALQMCIENNNIEFLKILLKNKNLNLEDQNIDFSKKKKKNNKIILKNKQKYIFERENSFFPILYAIKNENLELINILIEKKVNLNIKSKNSESLLMIVLKRDNVKMVKFLLNIDQKNEDMNKSKNFDINEKNHQGQTLIMITNNLEILKILLNHKPNLRCVDNFNNSLFKNAILKKKNLEIIKIFLEIEIKNKRKKLLIEKFKGILEVILNFNNPDLLKYYLEKIFNVFYHKKTKLTYLHVFSILIEIENIVFKTLIQNKIFDEKKCVFGWSPNQYRQWNMRKTNIFYLLIYNK